MAKDEKILDFLKAQEDTIENLEAIQENLNRCVEGGMIDSNATYYNELSALMDEASLAESWEELEEVVSKGKILEVDVAVWLAGRGQTSIALPWPKGPQP